MDRDLWRNISGSQDNCHIQNRNWDQITNIQMLVSENSTFLRNSRRFGKPGTRRSTTGNL